MSNNTVTLYLRSQLWESDPGPQLSPSLFFSLSQQQKKGNAKFKKGNV